MRIRSVELEGLWAYRERQHLDLGGVPLIVGVGENGVGKSAILVHAIVAAFFQKFPTKTQGGSVTHGLSSGHVSVEFDMNDTVYRIGRVFPRSGVGQGTIEVQDDTSKSGWRPLVNKGNREVTAELVKIIGMDYDTATMTWIAQQGEYGKFSASDPKDRFKLLSGVFGLGVYEEKRKKAAEKADEVSRRIDAVTGRIAELELTRSSRTASTDADADADRLSNEDLEAALVAENNRLDQVNTEVADLNSGDPERRVREAQAALDVVRSKRLSALEEAQREVARAVRAGQEAEQRHQQALAQTDARLTQALTAVDDRSSASRIAAERQKQSAAAVLSQIADAEATLPSVREQVAASRAAAAARRAEAEQLTAVINDHSQRRATLLVEWQTLKAQGEEAVERIKTLETSVNGEHAQCFTCHQHLSAKDAQALIDLTRADLTRIDERKAEVKPAGAEAGQAANAAAAQRETLLTQAEQADRDADAAAREQSRLETVIAAKVERQKALRDADSTLLDLDTEAGQEKSALHDTRDAEVQDLVKGYQRETARISEQRQAAEAQVQAMQTVPEQELDLEQTLTTAKQAVAAEVEQVQAARAALDGRRTVIRARINDLLAERTIRVEAANQLRELDARLNLLSKERSSTERELETYRTLVKAYSPTGIPAMVLAGMMGQLNDAINASLERLSRGQLQVRLAASKDGAKNTNDNKVTVYVETSQGTLEYENLSAGQKFRTDLAIRAGLADLIARGTGSPVETFILDEGWGTLDEQGIVSTVDALFRLSETMNVLTLTHIPAVRDAFPNRVEVELVGGTAVARLV
ncbi:SMC family ATPase [Curtobacterium sp. MCBD17_040]|uniref:AAA family ATPase n=1 Tax=Curtobacterium sp. MCBD17_040 TaxID=2175674 RepID=UPI000DA89621|nr:SMC family ATPase [Curtobacterium sp. MCBD17_040]WIB65678.1 SMC family ATPase [Curtobacterium sp. MCBD17_040]